MKKILFISILLISVGVFGQSKSVEERAEIQYNKISSKLELNSVESEFVKEKCIAYQTDVTNLRKEKDAMNEEEFHQKMHDYRSNFYTSIKSKLDDSSKLLAWDKMNRKVLDR